MKEEQIGLIKPMKMFESKSFSYDSTLNKLQAKLEETEKSCDEVKGQLLELQKSVVFSKDLKTTDLKALLSEN